MASALESTGGVRALVVGGCCELNTTAHELLVDTGSEIGAYNAAESGESLLALGHPGLRCNRLIHDITDFWRQSACILVALPVVGSKGFASFRVSQLNEAVDGAGRRLPGCP